MFGTFGAHSFLFVLSCGAVRESSVWRWCVFSSRRLCGALRCISSSRVSAPGRLATHTHTHKPMRFEKTLGLLVSLLWHRKLQLSLVSTTGTASCYHSLTTTTFGISCPPSLCLDPSWYYESCLSLFKHAGYAVGLE